MACVTTAGENEKKTRKVRDVLEVSQAALCLAHGIYEGEVGPSGKVMALSTSGALGLSVFLQHRVN